MALQSHRGVAAVARVEQLESRRLMSGSAIGTVFTGSETANAAAHLHVRARPNLNFIGSYSGTVNVKNAGKVSFNLEIDAFDPTQIFILGHISFIPIGRVAFDGTYKLNGPTFTFTTSKLANSLTLTGKLVKLGKTITGKFTLTEQGTTYSGKYTLARK